MVLLPSYLREIQSPGLKSKIIHYPISFIPYSGSYMNSGLNCILGSSFAKVGDNSKVGGEYWQGE